jgi:hypothetical protein
MRAARVTAKSDARSRPDAIVMDALARLAAGCGTGQMASAVAAGDASLLRSLIDAAALEAGMRAHLDSLAGADGVLLRRKSSSSSGLARKKDVSSLTDTNGASKSSSNKKLAFKLRDDATQLADTLLRAEAPLDEANKALERRDALAAVRLLNRLRAVDAPTFETRGRALLTARALPMLAATALPSR